MDDLKLDNMWLEEKNSRLEKELEVCKARMVEMSDEITELKRFARWVANELCSQGWGVNMSSESFELLQKEFKDCTEKQGFSIKETKE